MTLTEGTSFTSTLGSVNWLSLGVAAACIALSLVAAAYNLLGFAPLRLRLLPTVAAQLATSGLRLVAPAAVSTPVVATRYLKRSGASTSDALTTVAVAQSVQFVVTMVVVSLLGLFGGGSEMHGADGGTWLVGTAVVIVLGLALLAVRRYSQRFRGALRAARGSVIAIIGQVRRRPAMAVAGVLSAGALTVTHVLAFGFCVAAVGGHVSYLSLALIYLAAAGAGSLIPSPGGIGPVEAAMVAGLTAAGVTVSVAATAALLSRLISVWALVLPGWVALIVMRRRGLL